jgi:hypothetical protein
LLGKIYDHCDGELRFGISKQSQILDGDSAYKTGVTRFVNKIEQVGFAWQENNSGPGNVELHEIRSAPTINIIYIIL